MSEKRILQDPVFSSHPYSWSFNTLRFLGQWNVNYASKTKRILYEIYVYLALGLSCNILIGGLIDLYLFRHDFQKIAFNMCTTAMVFGITIKNFYIRLQSRRLDSLRIELYVESLKQTDPEDAIAKKSFEKIWMMYRNLFYLAAFTVLPFWLLSSLSTLAYGPRQMPFSIWLPLDIEDTMQFFMGFTYLAFSAVFIVTVTIQADLGMFSIQLQIATQYKILCNNILKLDRLYKEKLRAGNNGKTETNDVLIKEKTKQMLKKCVKRQLELARYTMEVEDCYNTSMMLQLICGFLLSVGNGLELILVSMDFSLKLAYQVGYSLIVLGDVMMVCTLSDLLIKEGERVVQSLYDIAWYDMNNQIKKDLMIMTIFAQKIIPLTAGKLFKLESNTFLGLVKNIYSWLALCRQLVK